MKSWELSFYCEDLSRRHLGDLPENDLGLPISQKIDNDLQFSSMDLLPVRNTYTHFHVRDKFGSENGMQEEQNDRAKFAERKLHSVHCARKDDQTGSDEEEECPAELERSSVGSIGHVIRYKNRKEIFLYVEASVERAEKSFCIETPSAPHRGTQE
ncbi:hypothetical protein AVEN_113817-1 [Araneus ventricosus]|uniref:Uncharacterized protein n=1 Tax=Araneus ventricosus TaxID=182803 RepID=A0A4Y2M0E2_ARAVE|nr:hypothetical protein AVEN_113817-1 [Araneus ventricosus]